MSWVADEACTLPTAQQPLRVAEFDALFAGALRGVRRLEPTRLELMLDGSGEVEATTRGLVARESACCSFFTFEVSRVEVPGGPAGLRVEVRVPAPYVAVLDGLAARAAETGGLAA